MHAASSRRPDDDHDDSDQDSRELGYSAHFDSSDEPSNDRRPRAAAGALTFTRKPDVIRLLFFNYRSTSIIDSASIATRFTVFATYIRLKFVPDGLQSRLSRAQKIVHFRQWTETFALFVHTKFICWSKIFLSLYVRWVFISGRVNNCWKVKSKGWCYG